jgi:hypothetical protein
MSKEKFDHMMELLTDSMYFLLRGKTTDAQKSLRLAISLLEDEQLKTRQKGCRYD